MGRFFVQQQKSAGAHGVIDPQVGMTTDLGEVTELTEGSGIAKTATGQFYPHQAFVSVSHATSDYAWPTGVGCHPYPNQDFAFVPPTGVSYVGPAGTVITYGR